jgi:hypothetical protein
MSSRTRRRRPIAVVLAPALACLAACTAPDPFRAREWIEVGAGVLDRHQRAGDPVDDGFGASIGGGYDMNDDRLRIAWELGGSASEHDVTFPPGSLSSGELDVGRVYTGLRGEIDIPSVPISVHARGGVMWRAEEDDVVAGAGNDQWGTYAGLGLDWWYGPGASLGPFVMWTRGEEDELEEVYSGLAARFYMADWLR